MAIQIFAEAFLQNVCECCGRAFAGRSVYRTGLRQCQECASGVHRHERAKYASEGRDAA